MHFSATVFCDPCSYNTVSGLLTCTAHGTIVVLSSTILKGHARWVFFSKWYVSHAQSHTGWQLFSCEYWLHGCSSIWKGVWCKAFSWLNAISDTAKPAPSGLTQWTVTKSGTLSSTSLKGHANSVFFSKVYPCVSCTQRVTAVFHANVGCLVASWSGEMWSFYVAECSNRPTDLGSYSLDLVLTTSANLTPSGLILIRDVKEARSRWNQSIEADICAYEADYNEVKAKLLTHTSMHFFSNRKWRTHPFNSPLSGTTQVSPYQKGKTNLDFTGARDSEWQWAICTSASRSRQITMPAPHYSVLLQAGCPSCRPTNSVKALKAKEVKKRQLNSKLNLWTSVVCSGASSSSTSRQVAETGSCLTWNRIKTRTLGQTVRGRGHDTRPRPVVTRP